MVRQVAIVALEIWNLSFHSLPALHTRTPIKSYSSDISIPCMIDAFIDDMIYDPAVLRDLSQIELQFSKVR